LLQPERKKHELKCRSKTKPGTLLKKQIAIRSGIERDEDAVGYEKNDYWFSKRSLQKEKQGCKPAMIRSIRSRLKG